MNELQRLIITAASEKKAFDILILDLRKRSDITDFFVICSGNSRIQVQAIADAVLKSAGSGKVKAQAVEGYSAGDWVLIDLVDVLVHIFHKNVRRHYDLERLWGDVPAFTPTFDDEVSNGSKENFRFSRKT